VSCEDKLLLGEIEPSDVFSLVDVHKFDSRLVTYWTRNEWRPVESDGHVFRAGYLRACITSYS